VMKFSIIIPVYNTGKYIERCLAGLSGQRAGDYEREIILIDDRSNDGSYERLLEFQDKNRDWVKVFRNERNLGPGLSRNVGVENAAGEWLVFLDSDDTLNDCALKELAAYIEANGSADMIGYDWQYDAGSEIKNGTYGGRWDLKSLLKSRDELVRDYVSLSMDGSVIFTAMKKKLLDSHQLKFSGGIHEDVDFLFKVYYLAAQRAVLARPLYLKNNRDNSIVNSISAGHIKGFMRALKEIYQFLGSRGKLTEETKEYFYRGLLRLISTEVRAIRQKHGSDSLAAELYSVLYAEYLGLLSSCALSGSVAKQSPEPKYAMIAGYYLQLMADKTPQAAEKMAEYLDSISAKSWSCYDLHNSLFLAPDEIRTCCKRFFVNNKMKGDVALLKGDKGAQSEFTPENILKAKQDLHVRINRGIAEECSGCPYLEFKDWAPVAGLKIEYISFEYSTVCNMKCSYCSPTYYGGKQAQYDVEKLLRQLFAEGSLEPCRTFMWGGGEPTLDRSFNKLITFMTSKYPNIKQRVFTNATQYSEVVNKLLQEDKIITITSIDAGQEETFYKVRKHQGLQTVLNNLKRYAATRPENMLIKYIITEHNGSLAELRAFVERIREYSLEKCNFQLSYDFNEESVRIGHLVSAIALFSYLSDLKVRFVFYDDLFWQRISRGLSDHYDEALKELKELDLARAFAAKENYQSVVVWGAGIQAKFLIEKSAFFKKVKIAHFVDNSPEKIGKEFLGYKVLSPDVLLGSDVPVLVAAVQNIPNILSNYYKLGLPESRLIKGLVI
jgi:poly(ribitol-phosphate) beta-N-acetylglucosaminyltransferase